MTEKCVIIGGGVAGLAAAIRLTELGIHPLIIEAGDYPAHKVCGEFFSPESLRLLHNWDIHPTLISKIKLHTCSKTLQFDFPTPAGGLSHIACDPLLLNKAKSGGATMRINTKVDRIDSTSNPDIHKIELSNGETILASQLIIATGRIPNRAESAPKMIYKGIKAHFSGIPIRHSIEMFVFKGSYIGISPIENGMCNVACLVSLEQFQKHSSTEAFLDHIIAQHPLLHEYFSNSVNLFNDWMTVQVPEFGVKKTLPMPRTYFIGDAAGTIPPATGNGLSMAISGGVLAAEYAFENNPDGFKQAWLRLYSSKIVCGKGLHHVMLRPKISNLLIQIGYWFPPVVEQIFKRTRI